MHMRSLLRRVGVALGILASGTLGSFADDLPRIIWERPAPPRSDWVHFSGDGQHLFCSSRIGTFEIRLRSDLSIARTITMPTANMFAVSPDETLVAATYSVPGYGGDSYVWLYRTSDGSRIWTRIVRPAVRTIVFSPDGTRFATGHGLGSNGYQVRVWSVDTGEVLTELSGPTHNVIGCDFSPDGTRIAATDYMHMVRVWNATGGPAFWASQGGGESVRFAMDGARVVATGAGTRVFDATNGALRHELDPPTRLTSALAVSPDGRRVVIADEVSYNAITTPVRAWDVETGALLAEGSEPGLHISTLAISPEGNTLASGGMRLTLWNALTLEHTLAFDAHLGYVGHVAFTADGQRLLSASHQEDRRVRSWTAADGSHEWSVLPHSSQLDGFDLARHGSRFVTNGNFDSVTVADADDGSPVRTIRYPATAVAISPDGETIAVTSATIRLFRVADGAQVGEFREHAQVPAVAFSPDGALLASAREGMNGGRALLRLWSIADGSLLWTDEAPGDSVERLAFSADGRLLLAASSGIEVRDSATGDVRFQQPLSGSVMDMTATPTSNALAYVFWEHGSSSVSRITIQRISDGAVLRQYETRENRRAFHSIAIAPDGAAFAIGRKDGTVFVAEMPHLPPGDVDRDGDVDLEDLSALLSSFGSCSDDPAFDGRADLDSNACIDVQDLALLLANFGI